ncbi:hypothetical protein BXY64_0754 [Marinifilum flexuosum]|uniref:Uncharacterized protein n=1 Tax=Marinifilum flexuosum TaxID=1117708 RepID=A0A419X7R7_9BACT|nr:hypothetical protein BXY64_0754 [Marinifilum flexuosum]
MTDACLGKAPKFDFSTNACIGKARKIDFLTDTCMGKVQKIDFLTDASIGKAQNIDFCPMPKLAKEKKKFLNAYLNMDKSQLITVYCVNSSIGLPSQPAGIEMFKKFEIVGTISST